jgi:hypothetical protein
MGKVFTMFYALVGAGVFVAVAEKIGAIAAEEQQRTRKRAHNQEIGTLDSLA